MQTHMLLGSLVTLLVAATAQAQQSTRSAALVTGTWDCVPQDWLPSRVKYLEDGTFMFRVSDGTGRKVFFSGIYKIDGNRMIREDAAQMAERDGKVTTEWYITRNRTDPYKGHYRSRTFEINRPDGNTLILKSRDISGGRGTQPQWDFSTTKCNRTTDDAEIDRARASIPVKLYSEIGESESVAERFSRPLPQSTPSPSRPIQKESFAEALDATIKATIELETVASAARASRSNVCAHTLQETRNEFKQIGRMMIEAEVEKERGFEGVGVDRLRIVRITVKQRLMLIRGNCRDVDLPK